MVAEQVRDYLQDGTIHNSVNFPEVDMPRAGGYRLSIANANTPNMLGQISTTLAAANLNIIDMINKSKGDLAYTLVDVETEVPEAVVEKIRDIEGVLSVRAL
jgi:D-3-phosphoglycerate dehydrogenase